MTPRDYQQEMIDEIIAEFRKGTKTILAQQPTGTGKTVIIAAIISAVVKARPDIPIWFVVPRKELMEQGSRHLLKWLIVHGRIAPGYQERSAYQVHMVSKGSHDARRGKIKRAPALIILDEAHLNFAYQLRLKKEFADSLILGLTATAERGDGKGLSVVGGGIFEIMISGRSIPWHIERGNLVRPKYHAFEIDGLDKIKRTGTEYDAAELDAKFNKSNTYGKVVDHYQKYGVVKKTTISFPGQPILKLNGRCAKGLPGIFFCRSVAIAERQAQQFQGAGFLVYPVSGQTPAKQRDDLIEALRRGEIDGLTTCNLITYGVDIPRAEYGGFLRPTMSKALYFQMMGRLLRPFTQYRCSCGNVWDNAPNCPSCDNSGIVVYRKESALLFDHVGNYKLHEDPEYPGVPLVYLPEVTWNFDGKKIKKADSGPPAARPCPFQDGLICVKPSCLGCEHYVAASGFQTELAPPSEEIDIQLVEIKAPMALKTRPQEEQREYLEKMNAAKAKFDNKESGAVADLCKVAEELQRGVMWVYHYLNKNLHTVNMSLLYKIEAVKKYKKGWAYLKGKALKAEQAKKAESLNEIRANHGVL